MAPRTATTLMHWGAFDVAVDDNRVVAVSGVAADPDSSPIGQRLLYSHENRVEEPHVRSSWLAEGVFANPSRRGEDELIPVDWETALDLAAQALEAVRSEQGNEAIYAGSYGWGSAGRFHHPPSQLKRFLNTIGGYASSAGTYSHAASEVVVPAVLGLGFSDFSRSLPSIADIRENTEVLISFGGFRAANTQIVSGGDVEHWYRPELRALAEAGCRLISLSPTQSDFDVELGVEWIPLRPSSDTALMLTLAAGVAERVEDRSFLDRYCAGGEKLRAALPKYTPAWASDVCGVVESTIADLIDLLVDQRSLVNTTWSTQRVHQGESAIWAQVVLGAVMGTIGKPGQGIIHGLGSMGSVGSERVSEKIAACPQGENPVESEIPCTRIADALENPGGIYRFAGEERIFPKIDLIYWCGGNPFHHHQDLNRLDALWKKPRAVIVNDPFWTATAHRADIVFPSTTGLERTDLGGGSTAGHLVHMQQALEPIGSSRNDYDMFAALASRFGTADAFTEGRTADEWVATLYAGTRAADSRLPETIEAALVERPASTARRPLHEFLEEPEQFPLATRSGRIELTLPHLDLPNGPAWTAPDEWQNSGLDLVTPMPSNRLHSQYNHVDVGPPAIFLTHADASARGLANGELAEVYNERGRCHGVIAISEQVMPGVASMENGAMLCLESSPNGPVCVGGNVNVLTSDQPSSDWAQATTAHTCRVEVRPAELNR